MNNAQREQIEKTLKRYRESICRLAVKLEELQMPYTSVLRHTLTRKELDGVQRYVSNHTLYPDIEGSWEE